MTIVTQGLAGGPVVTGGLIASSSPTPTPTATAGPDPYQGTSLRISTVGS